MAMTSRHNAAVKALQAAMATGKKHNAQALLEWEIACNTNSNRGKTYDQSELNSLYNRRGEARGASKATHLHDHNGNDFEFIVIKRHKMHGHIFHGEGTGNQLVDEIACWLKFEEKPESDFLCPILKYFTSKSDKVRAASETMQHNVIIIAQKACFVGDAEDACKEAEKLNRRNDFDGETARERYRKLEAMSNAQGWRDAMYNPGNSGVIFDHAQGCYKAVFIDYAL